jgi:two-component SAPR family response regulator
MVSLRVRGVAPSCWNQRSCSSSSNKVTNRGTRSHHLQWIKKTGLPHFSYMIQHAKQQIAWYDAVLHIR